MRPTPSLALTLLLLTGAAQAQTPMTAEEFEAFSTGQTLDYFIDGTFWGSERHLADRKTLDADAEGPCREGEWFPKDDMICFVYEGDAGEHCWQFFRDGSRVLAADRRRQPLDRGHPRRPAPRLPRPRCGGVTCASPFSSSQPPPPSPTRP
jgi:hypothetical protein